MHARPLPVLPTLSSPGLSREFGMPLTSRRLPTTWPRPLATRNSLNIHKTIAEMCLFPLRYAVSHVRVDLTSMATAVRSPSTEQHHQLETSVKHCLKTQTKMLPFISSIPSAVHLLSAAPTRQPTTNVRLASSYQSPCIDPFELPSTIS
jgi:hypothetical protein